ncbi:MAG TPA: adenylate/guanylate cyclase domain-containing protein, partial [Ilumatobacteraceae bacterium]|nr:adenylate/guanylate cyclase domain-containing protein [Ilumatobacteraceae bacterium]
RLATLSDHALRTSVVVALAGSALTGSDLLDGDDAAVDELVTIGAVRRVSGAVVFTHPLLRTTALDLAKTELIEDVAGEVLDRLESSGAGRAADAATLVRLSAAAQRAGTEHHRKLVEAAFDESNGRGSWSAAGDLAEYMVETSVDLHDRAVWLERLGKARFNELDRDDATNRLIEAAEAYAQCAEQSTDEPTATDNRRRRAECLILALRNDFTRGGQRRHPEIDASVGEIVDDVDIDRGLRARSAAILAEVTLRTPQHADRQQLVDRAYGILADMAAGQQHDPLTEMMVNFAGGMHRFAMLDLEGARSAFDDAERSSLNLADPFWAGGSLARRAAVAMCAGDPMDTISDATIAIDRSARVSNWAEHGAALAIRAVANTRLGRFADADNDTESTILSARRADSVDALLAPLASAMWRRAVRGDEPGVQAIVRLTHQIQMNAPYPQFVATALLNGVEPALEELRPRWSPPKRAIASHNIGFHISQMEATILTGDLEILDALFDAFRDAYQRGVRASYDWPLGIALMLASAAVELGDDSADSWLEQATEGAGRAGSVLEQALLRVHSARHAFMTGGGGQAELDQSRAALETLDALGAPLLARLQRDRLTAVAGRVGMPSGRVRTVMFTDIVESTSLMASAGNAAWAVILGEHHRIVRSVVGRFRGSIMTATGDGFAAWFESPTDAVEAARALHQAIEHAALVVAGGSVTVRVGLASGSVFDLGGDASGLAVAEAARVMSTATARETHLSRSVIEHGLDIGAGRSLGLHTLKGLPTSIEVFALASSTST